MIILKHIASKNDGYPKTSQDYITKFQKANTPTHSLPTARRKEGLGAGIPQHGTTNGIGLLDIQTTSTFTNSSTSHNEENIKRKHSTHAPHLHSLMSPCFRSLDHGGIKK